MITSASRKLHEQMNDQAVDSQLKRVFVNPASGNRPIKATFAYMWSEQDTGRGTLGRNGQFPEEGDLLRVAFNSDYFGDSSQFSLRNDVDYWAATLVHKMLHNLGYDHPQEKRDFIQSSICVLASTAL